MHSIEVLGCMLVFIDLRLIFISSHPKCFMLLISYLVFLSACNELTLMVCIDLTPTFYPLLELTALM